jgi:hypothetical protein
MKKIKVPKKQLKALKETRDKWASHETVSDDCPLCLINHNTCRTCIIRKKTNRYCGNYSDWLKWWGAANKNQTEYYRRKIHKALQKLYKEARTGYIVPLED